MTTTMAHTPAEVIELLSEVARLNAEVEDVHAQQQTQYRRYQLREELRRSALN